MFDIQVVTTLSNREGLEIGQRYAPQMYYGFKNLDLILLEVYCLLKNPRVSKKMRVFKKVWHTSPTTLIVNIVI